MPHQLILIHNHPSGAAEASPQDKVLTERIAQAAALFDIRLLDHIIIAREGDFSFLREGLISVTHYLSLPGYCRTTLLWRRQ